MPLLLKYLVTLLAALSLSTCGSNSIRIDVDLPVNQTPSPFVTLNASATAGIFFQFDRLVNNPTSINDLDGSPVIQFPLNTPFLDPDQESYDLTNKVDLDETRAYRVKMLGTLDGTAPADFEGVGDCPLRPGLGSDNIIHVCFGAIPPAQPAPLCTDTLPFSACKK